jgi:hypothetical protein
MDENNKDDHLHLAIEKRAQSERDWAHKTFAKILFERGFIALVSAAGLAILAFFLKQIGLL